MTTIGPKDSEPDKEKLEKLKEDHANETGNTGQSSDTNRDSSGALPNNQITSNAGEIPRKRGRPPGSKNKIKEGTTGVSQISSPILPEPVVRMIISLPYNLTAKKRGEHWKLSEEEITNMVPVHMALAQKYIPEWLKEHAEIYAALTFHGLAIFSRVSLDIELQRAYEEEKKRKKEMNPNESGKDIPREKRYGQVIQDEERPSTS